ncbi:Bifunctional dihydroflavonol 4-reductase/flavanone 4-reductase [Hordeum vulgare]|nr:Bifunctional dihydroflavonol 4-reductase/flavanone 4-reductase [Hordeum vulgare]
MPWGHHPSAHPRVTFDRRSAPSSPDSPISRTSLHRDRRGGSTSLSYNARGDAGGGDYWEAHQWKWIDSFHTTELVVKKYDKRQVRFHEVVSRLNFPFGMALIHLVPLELGVVIARMAREYREAREHLKTEATDEAYMEVIVISKDEVKGGEEDEFDVEEWQSIYPNYEDDDIGPSPTFTKGGMTMKGWLDVYYDSCVVLEVVDPGPGLGGGLGPGHEECTQA